MKHFSKGVSPWVLGKNWKFCPSLFFSKQSKPKCFMTFQIENQPLWTRKAMNLKNSKIGIFQRGWKCCPFLPKAQTAGAYPCFLSMKHGQECCYSSLDQMLVHCRVNPQQYVTGTHLYTCVDLIINQKFQDKIEPHYVHTKQSRFIFWR